MGVEGVRLPVVASSPSAGFASHDNAIISVMLSTA